MKAEVSISKDMLVLSIPEINYKFRAPLIYSRDAYAKVSLRIKRFLSEDISPEDLREKIEKHGKFILEGKHGL